MFHANIIILATVFPVFFIHKIKNTITYFYLLMPLLGLYSLLRYKKIDYLIVLLQLVFVSAIGHSLYLADFYALKRSVIYCLSFLFINFLSRALSTTQLSSLLKNGCIISLVFLIWESLSAGIVQKPLLYRDLFMPLAQGLSGYSNHTASLIVALVFSLFALKKYRLYGLLALMPLVFTWSRAGFIILLIGLACMGILSIWSKGYKIIISLLLALNIILPCSFSLVERLASDQAKIKIAQLSHARFPLELSFLEVFKDFPLLGVGTDRSHEYFKEYKLQGSSILENGSYNYVTDFATLGPHTTYVKVLAENGIVGFIPLLIFLILLVIKFYKTENHTSIAFLSYLLFFNFLNGLAEPGFYILTALVLRSFNANSKKGEDSLAAI